jgi:hypothetical protein
MLMIIDSDEGFDGIKNAPRDISQDISYDEFRIFYQKYQDLIRFLAISNQ